MGILIFGPTRIKANIGWSDIMAQLTGFDAVIINGHVTDIASGFCETRLWQGFAQNEG